MSTTIVDRVMDAFIMNEELHQMNAQKLGELQDRINSFVDILWRSAKDTEADRKLEMASDAQEDFNYVKEED